MLLVGDPEESTLYEVAVPLSKATDGLQANRIVTELSSDSGKGPWYRRPLRFGPSETRLIVRAVASGDFSELLSPFSRHRIAAFQRFMELEEAMFGYWNWLHHQSADLPLEERMFLGFVYEAAGWQTEPLDALVGHGITTLEKAAFQEAELRQIVDSVFDEIGTSWRPHRRSVHPERVITPIVSFYSNVEESFQALLKDARNHEGPFDRVLGRLRCGVETYGRLASFDQLQIWNQVVEIDELAPTRLKPEHVNTAGPKRGFERVFGVSMDELNREEIQTRLDKLIAFATEVLGYTTPRAVYAVETALCNYQKSPEDPLDEDPKESQSDDC